MTLQQWNEHCDLIKFRNEIERAIRELRRIKSAGDDLIEAMSRIDPRR